MPQWLLFFYIYCFLGWVWESIYVSVCEKHLVNRGFLKGPFLPIYGSGAVCILAVTIPVRGNILLMFLVGMVSATLLEYVTGAVMEKLFRVRYWDYSDKFLNVNGHICLISAFCWGFMTILMVDVIQVHVEPLVLQLGDRIIGLLVLVITPVVSADFVTSFIAAIHLRDALIMNDRIKAELEKMEARKRTLEKEMEKMREKAVAFPPLQTAGEKLLDAGEILQGAGEKLQGAGGKAYVQMCENLQGAGEKLQDVSAKTYAQIREELQEIYMRTGAYKEKLRLAYTKSTRGLLRRNPNAVSKVHRESFTELKKNLLEKIEEIRR